MSFVTAKLYELDDAQKAAKPGGKTALVQFNPETLKVSYANQIVDPPGKARSQSEGNSGRQYVGAGTTKLSLQLWFDINSPMPGEEAAVDDVRRLTGRVTALMNPKASGADSKVFVPPVVRFEWGSFKFDGLVDSLEESLEFFSDQGIPLRASMSLAMSQQKILVADLGAGGAGRRRPSPGAAPLAEASQGSTVQGMAEAAGKGGDWQGIAAANGVENPRRLPPGQLLDLSLRRLPS